MSQVHHSNARTNQHSMGIYKILIGDHFLSHTIITMMIAWLVILLITKFIKNLTKEEKR